MRQFGVDLLLGGDVLTYHVLGSRVMSGDVTNGAIVQPLSTTNTIKMTVTSDGNVFANQSNIVAVDVESDNGVVHVLDQVILPVETVVDIALDNGFKPYSTHLKNHQKVIVKGVSSLPMKNFPSRKSFFRFACCSLGRAFPTLPTSHLRARSMPPWPRKNSSFRIS